MKGTRLTYISILFLFNNNEQSKIEVIERKIPYDLTYKWNLINKTNKQAKYNQKHLSKEQTDSNQRVGEEDSGGRKGKGRLGTCIKDPWTKPKGGRIESGM